MGFGGGTMFAGLRLSDRSPNKPCTGLNGGLESLPKYARETRTSFGLDFGIQT
jgi:hypothetical protein